MLEKSEEEKKNVLNQQNNLLMEIEVLRQDKKYLSENNSNMLSENRNLNDTILNLENKITD